MVHNTITPDIETASEDYARRFKGEVGAYFLEVQARAVAQCLSTYGNKTLQILEVGGGHGQITESLLKAGHEVWIQGSADECFGRVKGYEAAYPGRVHFLRSPIWNIPKQDSSFDVAIALRLLAHVERWKELLAEMARLVRGGLILDYPARSALNALSPLLFGVKKRIEGNTRPYFSYSGRELEQELQTLGYVPERRIRQFFFPMGLHRALKRAPAARCLEGLACSVGLTRLAGSPVILHAIKSPSKSQ